MEVDMVISDKRREQSQQTRIKAGRLSLGEQRRLRSRGSGKVNPAKFIKGPVSIDCLNRPWHRGDSTGILAGPGVGKTTFSLHILKQILLNNEGGIVAFVSLEMTLEEIAEKWMNATQDCPELEDRLFVIENYDEQDRAKSLTIEEIKIELSKLKEETGEVIHAYVLDHLHEVDIGNSVDYNPLCRKIKDMSVELDSHGFILSQTTKGKGVGDIPVPKDGCYGTSRFENLMTHIITIFQPLKRVEKECGLAIMGWQYAKIRFKNNADGAKEGMNYLLSYDYDTEDLRPLDSNEVATFKMYYEKVLELRQNEEKFKAYQFDLSQEIKGENGKTVKLESVFGGHNPNDD